MNRQNQNEKYGYEGVHIRVTKNREHKHIGFCLQEYEKESCSDCPTLKECLEMRDKEIKERKEKNE